MQFFSTFKDEVQNIGSICRYQPSCFDVGTKQSIVTQINIFMALAITNIELNNVFSSSSDVSEGYIQIIALLE